MNNILIDAVKLNKFLSRDISLTSKDSIHTFEIELVKQIIEKVIHGHDINISSIDILNQYDLIRNRNV